MSSGDDPSAKHGATLTRKTSIRRVSLDRTGSSKNVPSDVHNFLAGAISGLITNCVLHPLDTLSARLKVQSSSSSTSTLLVTRSIIRKEGMRALYHGFGPNFLSCLPTDAVYFCTYEICKREGSKLDGVPLPMVHFLSGGIAEVACSLIYNPFEVIKTRMQLGTRLHTAAADWVQSSLPVGNYRHTPDAFATIVRTEGIRGLFAGYTANLATGCGLSAVQFMLYEHFKLALQKIKDAKLSMTVDRELDDLIPTAPVPRDSAGLPILRTRETLLAGAMAGSLAGFLTNPLDVVATRMMVRGTGGPRSGETASVSTSASMTARSATGEYRHCIRHLYVKEGFVGFFRGAVPRVLWCTPFSAISFSVFEKARGLFAERG